VKHVEEIDVAVAGARCAREIPVQVCDLNVDLTILSVFIAADALYRRINHLARRQGLHDV